MRPIDKSTGSGRRQQLFHNRWPFIALARQIRLMAKNGGGHPAMDYREHERTWAAVVRGSKIMIGLIAALLVLMAITIV